MNQAFLFVALKGDTFDGHDLPMQLSKKVLQGLSLKKDVPRRYCLYEVDNTLASISKPLNKEYRRRFDIPVVAITGSSEDNDKRNGGSRILWHRI
ncbi:MAG: hypothetical protein ACLUPK_02770 [Veillonella sp.]